ncbi:MAG: cupredoxin domain-containing protein [Dehalococcoidia bacterium]|nr:cupredoxin domain-containing protein [Dehalococcoidia bacterium]
MIRFRSLRVLGLMVMAAGVLGLAAACGGDSTPKAPATVNPNSVKVPGADGAASSSGGGASASGGGATIVIEMKDNVFAEKDIKVSAGQSVTFEAKNVGAAVHNVHILSQAGEGKDFNSDTMINPGKSSTFQAKFTKKGTYKFQCDFHVPDMVGTITVS